MSFEEDLDAVIREAEQERARNSLIDFACYVDRKTDQGKPVSHWYRAAHLKKVAEVLGRVERGELKRVIISLPLRHWKSSLASEKFPEWWLGKHPKDTFIVASYAADLATKFSQNVRDTIARNEKYRELFPATKLRRDSESKSDWALEGSHRGAFRAIGVGGGIAGYPASVLLIDDANDPSKAQSEAETEGVWYWYKNTARGRVETWTAIVIIANRTGADDLIEHLLDPERNDSADPPRDWVHIDLPAENPDGTYLWEDRFGREWYEGIKRDPYLWSVQFMQQVKKVEGAEILRDWFEPTVLPRGKQEECRVIDTAWTLKKTEKQDPDYFASMGSCMANGWLCLIDPHMERKTLPDAVDWIANRKKLTPYVRFGMAKAAGETISKQFLALQGIPIEDLQAETADIRVRLAPFISFASRGLIKIVFTDEEYEKWKQDKVIPARWEIFLRQVASFPKGHDDLLACGAGLTQMHGLSITIPVPSREEKRESVASMMQRHRVRQ